MLKKIIIFVGFIFILLGILVKPRNIEIKEKQVKEIDEPLFGEEPTKMVNDIFNYSDPWINRFSLDKMPKGSE